MIDLTSEKIIHKFLFFLVDFVRKFAPAFYLKTFLRSPEDAFLKRLSLVYLASILSLNSMNCTCMQRKLHHPLKFSKGQKPEFRDIIFPCYRNRNSVMEKGSKNLFFLGALLVSGTNGK